MEEAFLQFIWQYQSFEKSGLKTSAGENVSILKAGLANSDAGPDFLNGYVIIDGIEWFGHVEVHNKSSEWHKHKHEESAIYDNVILHVVLANDQDIKRRDGSAIPTIELRDRIDFDLYYNYKDLISSISVIPCHYKLPTVSADLKITMLKKAADERLKRKGELVMLLLKENKNDWEETAYQLLAKNLGFKINSDAFLELSKALPYRIIKKHADSPFQVEALLFGVANLIPQNPTDNYSILLKREYAFLSHKYNLGGREISSTLWRFLRLRPPNFPTLRISQLAAILASVKSLFSSLIEINDLRGAESLLAVAPSEYWQNHYNFGKSSAHSNHGLGIDSIENIIINTVCPLLSAFSVDRDSEIDLVKSVQLLENVKAENNKITRLYHSSGCTANNAFESQGLIELFNNYCSKKNCLHCDIGISIVREPRLPYNKTLNTAV